MTSRVQLKENPETLIQILGLMEIKTFLMTLLN